MGVLKTTYHCNWPGCLQTVTLTRKQYFVDVGWETRHSQTMHLCPEHAKHNARELDEAIRNGLRVLVED